MIRQGCLHGHTGFFRSCFLSVLPYFREASLLFTSLAQSLQINTFLWFLTADKYGYSSFLNFLPQIKHLLNPLLLSPRVFLYEIVSPKVLIHSMQSYTSYFLVNLLVIFMPYRLLSFVYISYTHVQDTFHSCLLILYYWMNQKHL